MSEESTQEGTQEQQSQTETQSESGRPQAELDLIAENKKYRQRAQDAEKGNKERDDAAEALKNKRLEEEGKLKELNESLTTANAALKTKADEWDADKAVQKEQLLESLPEDKRDAYKDFSLTDLRIVTKDLVTTPKKVVVNDGAPGSVNMTDKEQQIAKITQDFSDNKIKTLSEYNRQLAAVRAS